jgi:hypothetical protein
MKKLLIILLLVALAFAFKCRVQAAGMGFTDVSPSHYYFDEINALASAGVIEGLPDGRFDPESTMTQGEFAAALRRAIAYKSADAFDTRSRRIAADGADSAIPQPLAPITYEQVFVAVVSALGYSQADADRQGGYPDGYLAIANDLGLNNGLIFFAAGPVSPEMTPFAGGHLSKTFTKAPAMRGGIVQILYNIDFALLARCEEILADIIRPNMRDAEKVRAVHDYLVLHARYDHENYQNNTIPRESYTTRALLMNGVGVCSAYAGAANLLLNMAGVEAMQVSGQAAGVGGHAWNLVRIDGVYYHLDVTWDDPVPDAEGYVRYDYFAVSDETMARDHAWDRNRYPVCGANLDASAARYEDAGLLGLLGKVKETLGLLPAAVRRIAVFASIVALYFACFVNRTPRRRFAAFLSAIRR